MAAFTRSRFLRETGGFFAMEQASVRIVARRASGAPRRTLLTFALTDTLLFLLTYVGSVRPSVRRERLAAPASAAAVRRARSSLRRIKESARALTSTSTRRSPSKTV